MKSGSEAAATAPADGPIMLVDAGNTRLKWATLVQGSLTARGQAVHRESLDAALEAFESAMPARAAGALIANVAGAALGQRLDAALAARFDLRPRYAFVAEQQLGVRCGYRDPKRLGVDRWVSVLAAFHDVRSAVCVINAGTAVTFDAVDELGQHRGGLILAGPRLAAMALERNTAGIGPTSPAGFAPEERVALGRDTDEAVAYGAMLGLAAALDRAVAWIAAAAKGEPVVFITGGDAASLASWMHSGVRVREDLVLEGLALLARHDERPPGLASTSAVTDA